jgi:MFS family permease
VRDQIEIASEVATAVTDPASARGGAPANFFGRLFYSFEVRAYRWFWAGMVGTFAAFGMMNIAQGWLVYSLTGSATALGVVQGASSVSLLVFSLIGGVLADRLEKRNLVIVAQITLGLLAASVAVLLVTDLLRFWHLIIVSLLNGAVWSINLPGRQAFIAELVGESRLVNAMALNSAAFNLTSVTAPVVAGVLADGIGIFGVYFLIATAYGYVVLTLTRVPKSEVSTAREGASLRDDMIGGMRFVIGNPAVLSVLALGLIPTLFGMTYIVLLPVFAGSVLGMGASGFGLLMAASGAGALAGTLVLAWMGDFRHKGLMMVFSTIAFGIVLILFAHSTSIVLSLVLLALIGMASVATWTVSQAMIQILTPVELRGRIMSFVTMGWGLIPAGALPLGYLADVRSPAFSLTVGATIMITAVLLLLAFRPNLRTI